MAVGAPSTADAKAAGGASFSGGSAKLIQRVPVPSAGSKQVVAQHWQAALPTINYYTRVVLWVVPVPLLTHSPLPNSQPLLPAAHRRPSDRRS